MENLSTHLFESARPFFRERGYEYKPELKQFRRDGGDRGFRCVIFSITPYEDLAMFELHLGLRLASVESVAFPYTNGLPGFSPDSLTLVTPAARLKGERYERHQVRDEAEAETVLADVFDFLDEQGLPFLDEYFDLQALDELFNAEPMKPLDLVHNQTNRCLRGVTLARLAGRDDFDRLVRIYRQQLKVLHAPDFAEKKFEELVEFLRSYSAN